MSPVGFEPTISAGELPQTYALDRVTTGIGHNGYTEWPKKIYTLLTHQYLWNKFKLNFYFRVRV